MPKKWGVNDKKAEVQDKKKKEKESKRLQEQEQKEKEEWAETDKHVLKKMERKQKEQEKKEAALKRKQEKKDLYEKEMQELAKDAPAPRITQAEASKIKQDIIKETLAKVEPVPPKPVRTSEDSDEEDKLNPVPVNINHIRREEEERAREQGIKVVSASGLTDALAQLAVEEPDRHPEKRMKKAYEEYMDKMMPRVKVEYPGLKRSQYLQMIQKEWKNSPENPMNRPTLAYNEK
jgi:hypothetical protein